jgi:hypothetical protein
MLRHKGVVFLATIMMALQPSYIPIGLRLRLLWFGISHDWSRFLPSEWGPYAEFFYGENGKATTVRDKAGHYKPADTGDEAFDFAWLLHQKRNRHHWQWWILPEDDGRFKVLEMGQVYVLEMICDWMGAGRAQRKPDIGTWYLANHRKMQLSDEARGTIEFQLYRLGYLDEAGLMEAARRDA